MTQHQRLLIIDFGSQVTQLIARRLRELSFLNSGVKIVLVDERGRPVLHEHKKCGKLFEPVMICSECGEPLSAKSVHVHPGPGARRSSPVHARAQERAKRGAEST